MNTGEQVKQSLSCYVLKHRPSGDGLLACPRMSAIDSNRPPRVESTHALGRCDIANRYPTSSAARASPWSAAGSACWATRRASPVPLTEIFAHLRTESG